MKLRRINKLLLWNLIILLFLLELTGLGLFFFKHKTLFYFHKKQEIKELQIPETKQKPLINFYLHPFFGYTEIPNGEKTNNWGFHCQQNLPFFKTEKDQVIIGIFGGSVADFFHQEMKQTLAEKLLKTDQFSDKKIVYLNLALPGYKQPQQLLIYSYLLTIGQRFDIVLNIDGFNEAFTSVVNNHWNIEPAMPSFQIMKPLTDLINDQSIIGEKLETMARIQKIKKRAAGFRQKAQNAPLAFLYLIYSGFENYYSLRLKQENLRLDSLINNDQAPSMVNMNSFSEIRDPGILYARIVDQWTEASQAMQCLSDLHGIDYIHILQPNQYFSRKKMSPEEERYAVNKELNYYRTIPYIYPLMSAGIPDMQKKGIHVFDATTIFDSISKSTYRDNCCHYTRLGNELLADFIFSAIMQTIRQTASYSRSLS